MAHHLFASCGFSEKEQLILQFLAHRVSSSASVIAKGTHLKRPTVYAILESLEEQGFILRNNKGSTTLFSLIPLSQIPKVIEIKAKHHFEKIKEASRILAEDLQKLPDRKEYQFAGFELTKIESADRVLLELEEALLKGDYCGIFNPQLLNKETQRITAQFLQHTSKSKPHIREIIVRGPLANWYKSRIHNENHLIKEIDPSHLIETDIILTQGSVVLAHYTEGNAIRITQPNYYTSMTTLFELLWTSL